MDGPFKNTNLSARWKQYGDDLVSDATSLRERVVQACHSMLGDEDPKPFSALFSALQAKAEQIQSVPDPISLVKEIFEGHPPSLLNHTFQRQLTANLRDSMSYDQALDQALSDTVVELIEIAKDRFVGECILARDRCEMTSEECRKAIKRNDETFSALPINELCRALVDGDRRAFNQPTRKKRGVDEGPDE